jgi:hypothetical protein
MTFNCWVSFWATSWAEFRKSTWTDTPVTVRLPLFAICPSRYVTLPPARLLDSLICRFEIGRLDAYGSAVADTGATVVACLPCSITRKTTPATTRTVAAAITRGSQFRSRAVVEAINSGPSLTSGFYTRYLRDIFISPIPAEYLGRAFIPNADRKKVEKQIQMNVRLTFGIHNSWPASKRLEQEQILN